MGMLERYKKRGGFIQLLNLLETTDAVKKEKFMKMILEEDPNWDAALRQRMLSFDKLLSWDTTILMEFLPQVPVMAIAYAVSDLSPEDKSKILKALSFGDQKKIEEILKDAKPKPGEIISSRMKVITELRTQVSAGKLKLERVDPNLAIPEDIEENIASAASPVKKTVSVDVDWSKDPGTKTNASPAQTATATTASTQISPKAASVQMQNNSSTTSVAGLQEELNNLKKKMMALTQENVRLMKEVEDYKGKLAAIKAAFQKTG